MKQGHLITLGLALSLSGVVRSSAELPAVISAIPPRSLPAIGLLPEGSNLQGVLIPRYDKERNLVASLRAELMTVVTKDEIEALGVNLKLFGSGSVEHGEVTMQQATYNHASGMIRSNKPVQVSTPSLRATGSGLVVQMSREPGGPNSSLEGFLLGPVETTFYKDRHTSMKRPASLTSLALVCLALTDPLLAAGPVPLRPEELEAIDLQVERVQAPDHAEDTARMLSAGEGRARATEASMQAFAKRSAVLINEPAAAAVVADAADASAGPAQAGVKVESEGGMYFDAEKNVIVYTKNIRLDEGRFQLACDDQLQVFLKNEPKKAAAKPEAEGEGKPEPEGGEEPKGKPEGGLLGVGGAGISGIERIIATGNVRVTSKDPQGSPIVASAETAVYEAATEAFILKGGLPQIQRGPSYQRALEPGIYIRYTRDGNFEMSEGKKETFIVLPEKNK